MADLHSKPRPAGDFSRYLATREAPLLVGGQAVNLWALLYKGAWPMIYRSTLFVSGDGCLLGCFGVSLVWVLTRRVQRWRERRARG